MERIVNQLRLTGTMANAPVFSHELFGEAFYQFTLSVPRLSGVQDHLPVTASERLLTPLNPKPGMQLRLEGQARSYNKVINGAGRLLITAFAQQLYVPQDEQNPNTIQLVGALCKPPAYRTTPFGREIADLMLAVNRAYGKSDYIPCIAWGRNARFASRMSIGDQIQIDGRLQSRPYQKQMPDGAIIEKIAYEVSVGRLESIRSEGALPVRFTQDDTSAPVDVTTLDKDGGDVPFAEREKDSAGEPPVILSDSGR
ncbi:MAG: single-stranded DNA-binding protein [Oscillospiraceae bacterium]|jgi:single-stranded DNA-binding protein|nr:single-stranded DNA-binding protein [Oscillospiraceae bacterium]